MPHIDERRIQETGRAILSGAQQHKKAFSMQGWTQSLLDRMMENDAFRVAALRFTDVAPTLRNDHEFMDHLSAYFAHVGGLKHFLGDGIPGSGLLGKIIAPIGRKNIKAMARTFIAGETVEDGLKTLHDLHKQGLAGSIDLLGEAVLTKEEADGFVDAYHHAIDVFAQSASWQAAGYPEEDKTGPLARANLSVKLSALYEHVDPAAHAHSCDVLTERFSTLLEHAMDKNVYLHVDVEQYSLLPLTLDVFERVLLDARFKHYPHVGIVCQAYLKESGAVLRRLVSLAKERGTPFSIRLVKGAYWDYEQALAEQMEWPCPVFDHKEETDKNYEALTLELMQAFPHVRPCIGSHNARSQAVAIEAAEQCQLTKADFEFQCLYGMAEGFRNALKDMGYRVRVYCPVGEFIPGMSYLVRRLLENTANQSFLRKQGYDNATLDELLKSPLVPTQETITGELKPRAFLNHPLMDFSLDENRARATEALQHYEKNLPQTVSPLINGKKVKPQESLTHICPWNSAQAVTTVGLATPEDVDTAISAAQKGMEAWRAMGAEKRAAILEKAAELASEQWDELFALQVYEAGKDWENGDGDIAEAIDFMRFYAQSIRTLETQFQPMSVWGESNKMLYEPRGITAVIAPWNFPFAISTGMTVAALAAGNAVLYKPAEQTSLTGLKMVEILHQAGVPTDMLHFLPGKGEEVGAYMVAHKDVATIAFTGSRDVGLHILKEAAIVRPGQRFVKKCIIEMGGKNAIIVDSDADLDEAVPGVLGSAFGFQGQKCSACSRAIVVGSAYDTFVHRMKELVSGLRVGSPVNPMHDVNSVIDAEAQKKIMHYIQVGREDGTLLAQASACEGGAYVPPTVFTDVPLDSRLTKEEVFGPVLVIYRAKDMEEAIRMAMDSEYALTGGVYSRNPKSIAYAREHFRVGNLYINRGSTGALVGRQPFGGGALSGTGTKAGGLDYLLNFLEPRVVTENTMRRGFAPKEDV